MADRIRLDTPRLPVHEAAAMFREFTKTAGFNDPPDTTGALEGPFAAPIEQVLEAFADMATSKLRLANAYNYYAEVIRAPYRDALATHFREHRDQETEGAEFFLRRLAVLGGAVHLSDIEAPPAFTDPIQVIPVLIRAEQEAVSKLTAILQLVGNNPSRYEIESMSALDQHHVDDLWQFLPAESRSAVIQERKTASAGVTPEEAGEIRARANAASRRGMHSATRGEQVGELVGRLGGAAAGARLLRKEGPIPALAAAYLGNELGKHTGGFAGRMVDDYRSKKASIHASKISGPTDMGATPFSPAPMFGGNNMGGNAMGNVIGVSGNVKGNHGLAQLYSMGKLGSDLPEEMNVDPDAYLQQQQQAQQAAREQELEHYRTQFQQAAQELQIAQQQVQQLTEQAQQLQQQAEQSEQSLQQVLDQSRATQQSAISNMMASNAAASSSMQQTLATSNELMQQKQLSVQMRDAYNNMRGMVADISNQNPPPATTDESNMSLAQQEPPPPEEVQPTEAPTESPAKVALDLSQKGRWLVDKMEPARKFLSSDKGANTFLGAGALLGAGKHLYNTYGSAPNQRVNEQMAKAKVLHDKNPSDFGSALEFSKAVIQMNEQAERKVNPLWKTFKATARGAALGRAALVPVNALVGAPKAILDTWDNDSARYYAATVANHLSGGVDPDPKPFADAVEEARQQKAAIDEQLKNVQQTPHMYPSAVAHKFGKSPREILGDSKKMRVTELKNTFGNIAKKLMGL